MERVVDPRYRAILTTLLGGHQLTHEQIRARLELAPSLWRSQFLLNRAVRRGHIVRRHVENLRGHGARFTYTLTPDGREHLETRFTAGTRCCEETRNRIVGMLESYALEVEANGAPMPEAQAVRGAADLVRHLVLRPTGG